MRSELVTGDLTIEDVRDSRELNKITVEVGSNGRDYTVSTENILADDLVVRLNLSEITESSSLSFSADLTIPAGETQVSRSFTLTVSTWEAESLSFYYEDFYYLDVVNQDGETLAFSESDNYYIKEEFSIIYPNAYVFERSSNIVTHNSTETQTSVALKIDDEIKYTISRNAGNKILIDDLLSIARESDGECVFVVGIGSTFTYEFTIEGIAEGRGAYEWGQMMSGGWCYPLQNIIVPIDSDYIGVAYLPTPPDTTYAESFESGVVSGTIANNGITALMTVQFSELRSQIVELTDDSGSVVNTVTLTPARICSDQTMVYWLDRYGIEQSFPFAFYEEETENDDLADYVMLNDDLSTTDVYEVSAETTYSIMTAKISKAAFDHCKGILTSQRVWFYDSEVVDGEDAQKIIVKATGSAAHSGSVLTSFDCELVKIEKL